MTPSNMNETQSYTIMIDESQRKLLLAALSAFVPVVPNVTIDDHEERDLLVAMFHDLPRVESEDPNCLHGFCL